jgi:spore germination protein YaaH
MDDAQQVLADLGVTSSYDETTGQQYAEWTAEDGRLCQIWLETDDSIASRAALVSEYDLGGIAAWVLGSQDDSVWEIISAEIS